MTTKKDDTTPTAVQMLEEVGRALTPGENWPSALAGLLGVEPNIVRDWRSGRVTLRVDHLKRFLAVVTRRRWELLLAEKRLQDWLSDQPRDRDPK